MMVSDSSESIKLAVEDFKKSYYKETDKTKLVEPIKNLINASAILFETEFIKNERFLSRKLDDIVIALGITGCGKSTLLGSLIVGSN